MVGARAARRGPGAVPAALLVVVLGLFAGPFVRAGVRTQDEIRTCFVCHSDSEAESAAGTSIFVDPDVFNASVHAKTGRGCVGCHADLAGVEEFPHAPDLAPVICARCHPAYGPGSRSGVHAVRSPRLVAKPVLCGDCHGYHDVQPSAVPASRVHASSLPATCGRCHPQAGPNYARGRVHELEAASRRSPAGVVRALYRLVIGVTVVLGLAYIAVDIVRRRAGR